MREFVFSFVATRFSGLSHADDPRQESIKVSADSFEEAVEKLRDKLHNFIGSNSFVMFVVDTSYGRWIVKTEPSPLFDIYGVLTYAKFVLGEQLAAA